MKRRQLLPSLILSFIANTFLNTGFAQEIFPHKDMLLCGGKGVRTVQSMPKLVVPTIRGRSPDDIGVFIGTCEIANRDSVFVSFTYRKYDTTKLLVLYEAVDNCKLWNPKGAYAIEGRNLRKLTNNELNIKETDGGIIARNSSSLRIKNEDGLLKVNNYGPSSLGFHTRYDEKKELYNCKLDLKRLQKLLK